ncbi:MAG: VCBS repeat-containing protein [Candidatus Omnitrophica bacterium]|nr:VCBS repeat-containing protein [Candidatus Omnitrophota bacterium]
MRRRPVLIRAFICLFLLSTSAFGADSRVDVRAEIRAEPAAQQALPSDTDSDIEIDAGQESGEEASPAPVIVTPPVPGPETQTITTLPRTPAPSGGSVTILSPVGFDGGGARPAPADSKKPAKAAAVKPRPVAPASQTEPPPLPEPPWEGTPPEEFLPEEFMPPPPFEDFPPVDARPISIEPVPVDIDGDGDEDLIRVDPSIQTGGEALVEVMVRDAGGNLADEAIKRLFDKDGVPFIFFASAIRVEDFNQDGVPDLVLTVSGVKRTLKNDGEGIFREVIQEPSAPRPGALPATPPQEKDHSSPATSDQRPATNK